MDSKDLKWAISLSMVSFLGTKYDVKQILKSVPIYRRHILGIRSKDIKFNISISLEDLKNYDCHDRAIFIMNNIYGVRDRDTLFECLESLASGSGITWRINIERKKMIGMSCIDRDAYIKAHLTEKYDKQYYKEIMYFDHSWSSKNLRASDYANAISLARLGLGMDWITEEEAIFHILKFAKIIHKEFIDFKQFGISVAIGQKLQNRFIYHLYKKGASPIRSERGLSKAYFAFWRYMSW